MPPRSRRPCMVPGCRGLLETGTRDGRLVDWCPVCERRILQLRMRERQVAELEARLATPPASGPLSDDELLALIPQRFMSAKACARSTRRSSNVTTAAIKTGEIHHVRLGRLILVSRASAKAWAASWTRRRAEGSRTRKVLAVLPREASAALGVREIAEACQLSPGAVSQWASAQKGRRELQRVAALDARGKPILRFWWQEEAPRA